jgi:ribonuclease Y
MQIVVGLLVGLIGGGVVMAIIQQTVLKSKREKLIKDAELEGENIKKDKLLQAKENFLKLKEEHEVSIKEKERRIQSGEDRIRNKEK